jgi:alkanesulfonate monooxygenase SsuD/methylene tetrahydromethanopterin reductase-like flavin-dependent oxidoreductase (luciferase family)
LQEAINVMRALWRAGPPAHVDGVHYRLDSTQPGPRPRHDIAIWVGGIGPRMLRLIGRTADGWLPSSPRVPPTELAARNRIIDDAAEAAGRAPSDVRRLYNITGRFTPAARGFLHGPPRVWAEQLAGLTLRDGISAFNLATDSPDDIRRFAEEVLPHVRELVTAERGGAP